jgi:8-oxo-dGTP diphosphatase
VNSRGEKATFSAVTPGNATDLKTLPVVSGSVGSGHSSTLEISPPQVEVVRAAGGLVVRRSRRGRLEVVIVHRPGREDWTFPKGKLEPGETFEDCARREVEEETGLRCRLGRFLGHTEYRDRKDRPKIVAYWSMAPESGVFRANEEVDDMRWVAHGEAGHVLTYDRDRALLASAYDLVGSLV